MSEPYPAMGSVAARTATIALVSNTGQPILLGVPVGNTDKIHTQGFTTGSNALGYKLDSVGVRIFSLATGGSLTVHIYTADASGAKDDLVHTLGTLETRTSNAVRQFTAPADATLFPDTDYLVVFEAGGPTSSHVRIHATSSDAEDLGSAAGWSIENRRRYNNVLVTPSSRFVHDQCTRQRGEHFHRRDSERTGAEERRGRCRDRDRPGVRPGDHRLHRLGGQRRGRDHRGADAQRQWRHLRLPRRHRLDHRGCGRSKGRPPGLALGGGEHHQGRGHGRGRHHHANLHGGSDAQRARHRPARDHRHPRRWAKP